MSLNTKELLQHLLENKGFSIAKMTNPANPQLDLLEATEGYVVSPFPQWEVKIPSIWINTDLLKVLLKHYWSTIKSFDDVPSNALIGAWVSDAEETIYFDLSIHTTDFVEAVTLAREHGQLAIFNLADKSSIYLSELTPLN